MPSWLTCAPSNRSSIPFPNQTLHLVAKASGALGDAVPVPSTQAPVEVEAVEEAPVAAHGHRRPTRCEAAASTPAPQPPTFPWMTSPLSWRRPLSAWTKRLARPPPLPPPPRLLTPPPRSGGPRLARPAAGSSTGGRAQSVPSASRKLRPSGPV